MWAGSVRRICSTALLALYKIAPVGGTEKTQAGDAVPDRHLVRSLRLAFGLHKAIDRQALFGNAILDPGRGQRNVRTLSLQMAGKFREKCAG